MLTKIFFYALYFLGCGNQVSLFNHEQPKPAYFGAVGQVKLANLVLRSHLSNLQNNLHTAASASVF